MEKLTLVDFPEIVPDAGSTKEIGWAIRSILTFVDTAEAEAPPVAWVYVKVTVYNPSGRGGQLTTAGFAVGFAGLIANEWRPTFFSESATRSVRTDAPSSKLRLTLPARANSGRAYEICIVSPNT